MRVRLVLALLAALVPTGGVAVATAGNGGNSANAEKCQQGGWQTSYRADGTSFTNPGDCVSYAANGGTFAQTGTITITKTLQLQQQDAQDFSFNLSGATVNESFLLDDDADPALSRSRTFIVPLGSYTLSEVNIPNGWLFVSLVCAAGAASSAIPSGATATIQLGDSVECTFTNRPI